MTMIDELVDELSKTYNNKSRVKLAVCKAINTVPENRVKRFAELLLKRDENQQTETKQTVEVIPEKITKQKRGRKPLHRGKMILAGTKHSNKDFWKDFVDPIRIAKEDKYFPKAQPGGNYKRVKDFLRNEWSSKKTFKITELKEILGKKYPENSESGGFRIQRWGNAFYWENTGELAVKPLWKKFSRFEVMNIFFEE